MAAITEFGSTLPTQLIKACVVYDSKTGVIRHRHFVMTVTGGQEPDEHTIAADAMRGLKKQPNSPDGEFEVLHIHHEAMVHGKQYHVDVHGKTLVQDYSRSI